MDRKHSIEISWTSLWRILFFILFILIIYIGKDILLGLFLAIVISSGLETAVDFLEKHGLPRTLGVILIFLTAAVLFLVIVYTIVPVIIADLNTFLSNTKSDNAVVGSLLNFKKSPTLTSFINKLSTDVVSGNTSLFDIFSSTLGNVGLALSVLVISFYLSINHDGVERFIKAVFPEEQEKVALRVYARSRKHIGAWFQNQLLLSVLMAVLAGTALWLLGLKHAVFLGILAGVFELLPFIGPIISGAVAVLVAVATSPALALWTLIVFLVLQQFESNILVPMLTKRSVNLHPVIVIVALLIGIQAGGLLGALIAVPAAAVFQEIVDEWSSRKRPREALVL